MSLTADRGPRALAPRRLPGGPINFSSVCVCVLLLARLEVIAPRPPRRHGDMKTFYYRTQQNTQPAQVARPTEQAHCRLQVRLAVCARASPATTCAGVRPRRMRHWSARRHCPRGALGARRVVTGPAARIRRQMEILEVDAAGPGDGSR